MRRQAAAVAMAGLLMAACGPADVDYTQTAREQCIEGAYRDAGADGAVVDAVLDTRLYCRVTCADGWGTCRGGPACGQVIHTDENCNACGDRCIGSARCFHDTNNTPPAWICASVSR